MWYAGTMWLGVDLGGTKIEAILLDPEERARKRVPAPQGSYDETLRAIAELVRSVEAEAGISQSVLGIGTPGSVSRVSGCLKNSNSTWLNGKPLREDLSKTLDKEIRIANDADCFTLSEAVDGAAAKYQNVFGVILGTGVGGGISWNKQLLSGPNGIAGEWGHNPLPGATDNRECYCGRRDCIETYCSGPGLAKTAGREASTLSDDDPAWEVYDAHLARALSMVVNILDPDCVVLGGGLSQRKRLYTNIPKLWRQWVFSDRVDTALVPPRFGDSSGVRGAAWLCRERQNEHT